MQAQTSQRSAIGELSDYPLHFQQTVAWGDMDAFGHVNNVMYYRYFESARIEYLEQFNIFNYDVITVISKSDCRYLSPVFYPDQLVVATRVEEMRNSALRMRYTLANSNMRCDRFKSTMIINQLSKSLQWRLPI